MLKSSKIYLGYSLAKERDKLGGKLSLNNTYHDISEKKNHDIVNWESTKASLLIKVNLLTEENKKLKLRNSIMENRINNLEIQLSSIAVIYIIKLGRETIV